MADSRSAHAKSHSRSSAPPPTAPQNRTQSLSSAAPASRHIPKPQESGQSPKLARSVSKSLGLSAGGSSSRGEQRSEGSSNSGSRMLGPVVEMQPVVQQQQQPARVKMSRPVSATPELSRERDRELRKSAKTPTLATMAEAPASRPMRPKSTTAEMMLRDDGRSGSLRNAKSNSELQQQQPPASRPSHRQSGAADSGTGSLRASAASPAFPGEKKTMIKYMLHEVRELKRQVDPNATDAVARRHGGDSSEGQRSSRGDSQEDVRSPGSHSQSHTGSMSRLNESPASSTGGFRVGTPKSALSYKQRLLGRLQKYAVCANIISFLTHLHLISVFN